MKRVLMMSNEVGKKYKVDDEMTVVLGYVLLNDLIAKKIFCQLAAEWSHSSAPFSERGMRSDTSLRATCKKARELYTKHIVAIRKAATQVFWHRISYEPFFEMGRKISVFGHNLVEERWESYDEWYDDEISGKSVPDLDYTRTEFFWDYAKHSLIKIRTFILHHHEGYAKISLTGHIFQKKIGFCRSSRRWFASKDYLLRHAKSLIPANMHQYIVAKNRNFEDKRVVGMLEAYGDWRVGEPTGESLND